jgi:ribosomal protein S18 acetylase RimI-like enzyme
VSDYRIEPLAGHERGQFSCGVEALDRYFREQVTQDIRRRIASCFVAIDIEGGDVAAYYTLSATAIALDLIPAQRAKRLPRYPVVPAVLLGRLAVATAHQGRQLGAALVADAILRSTRSEVTGHALVVDAKNEAAVRFYERLDFTRLPGEQARLIRFL